MQPIRLQRRDLPFTGKPDLPVGIDFFSGFATSRRRRISPHLRWGDEKRERVWWRSGSAHPGQGELLNNSINIDKFTGFFDKLTAIYFLRK